MPERIQLSRAKGWRMPPNTVSVARPTRWGNPYVIGKDYARSGDGEPREVIDAAHAVALFRERVEPLTNNPHDDYFAALRGKNLACWCKLGEPCHADVLLELANADERTEEAATA